MKTLLKLFFLLSALILTACTTTQKPMDNASWRMQRQKLNSITNWSISGKLAIITPEKKGSARIRWQQHGDDFDLNLTSVIGTRIMEMHKNGQQVLIVDDKGHQYYGTEPEELVYRLTGWQMPVTQLPIWIKGLPGDSDYDISTDGQLKSIKAQNWQMDYQSYQDVSGWMMPEKITFTGPKTELRLAINEWEFVTQ